MVEPTMPDPGKALRQLLAMKIAEWLQPRVFQGYSFPQLSDTLEAAIKAADLTPKELAAVFPCVTLRDERTRPSQAVNEIRYTYRRNERDGEHWDAAFAGVRASQEAAYKVIADLAVQLRQAEETRSHAQAEATRQTNLRRDLQQDLEEVHRQLQDARQRVFELLSKGLTV